MNVVFETVEQTRGWGTQLASVLRAGDLVVLAGPLGAGKTALTQGIGAGLRVRGAVTSPTFVIARVHPPDVERGGTVSLVHVDAYRLGGIAEVDDLDLDADLAEAVTVVEWGAGMVEQLTDAHLMIELTPLDQAPPENAKEEPLPESADRAAQPENAVEAPDVAPRRATVRPVGADWSERLAKLD